MRTKHAEFAPAALLVLVVGASAARPTRTRAGPPLELTAPPRAAAPRVRVPPASLPSRARSSRTGLHPPRPSGISIELMDRYRAQPSITSARVFCRVPSLAHAPPCAQVDGTRVSSQASRAGAAGGTAGRAQGALTKLTSAECGLSISPGQSLQVDVLGSSGHLLTRDWSRPAEPGPGPGAGEANRSKESRFTSLARLTRRAAQLLLIVDNFLQVRRALQDDAAAGWAAVGGGVQQRACRAAEPPSSLVPF